jgi:hypothetical protein
MQQSAMSQSCLRSAVPGGASDQFFNSTTIASNGLSIRFSSRCFAGPAQLTSPSVCWLVVVCPSEPVMLAFWSVGQVDHDAIQLVLRSRSRLGWGQIEQLIDAIYGRTGKPAVAPARVQVARHRFIVRLRKAGVGEVAAAAQADGKPVADEERVRLGPGFHYSYAEFLQTLPAGSRQASVEEVAAQRERGLLQVGREVGRMIFSGRSGPEGG